MITHQQFESMAHDLFQEMDYLFDDFIRGFISQEVYLSQYRELAIVLGALPFRVETNDERPFSSPAQCLGNTLSLQ